MRNLTPHEERAVAVAAGVDPRTVRAYLDERRCHSTSAARIEAAMRLLGHRDGGGGTEGRLAEASAGSAPDGATAGPTPKSAVTHDPVAKRTRSRDD
jgi:hypothetical protein